MTYFAGNAHRRAPVRTFQAIGFSLTFATGTSVALTHPVAASPLSEIIATMNEGDWAKVNTNSFSDVWVPADQRPNANDPGAIIRAWSSFAWDSSRDEMILWGGGHNNYGGNEVYTWNGSTLQWTRASLPSALQSFGPGAYLPVDGPTNSPIASHTYDNQEYLPVSDRFITFGGAAYDNGSPFWEPVGTNGWAFTGPYVWDPSKADPNKVGGVTGSQVDPAAHPEVVGGQMWENRDKGLPNDVLPKNGASDAVVENGKDVVYFTGVAGNGTIAGLYKYTINDVNNPAADTWQQVGGGTNGAVGSDSGSGALDTDRQVFVRTSGLNFIYWDLSATGDAMPHLFTPLVVGDGFAGMWGAGVEWDPERKWFDLWMGNGDVWYLIPPELMSDEGWIIEKAPDPIEALTPSTSDSSFFSGVLGKWKYVDEYDVFMGLDNDLNGDVWVYKPVGWAGDTEQAVASVEPGWSAILGGGLVFLGLLRLRRLTSAAA